MVPLSRVILQSLCIVAKCFLLGVLDGSNERVLLRIIVNISLAKNHLHSHEYTMMRRTWPETMLSKCNPGPIWRAVALTVWLELLSSPLSQGFVHSIQWQL